MDELLSILAEIRDQLGELNNKIDVLTGSGVNDISDIVNALDEIRGSSGYDLTDIYQKIDAIETQIMLID